MQGLGNMRSEGEVCVGDDVLVLTHGLESLRS